MISDIKRGSWLTTFAQLRFHPLFEAVVVFIIVASALVAGAKTFPATSQHQDIFKILDYLITGIFLFELLIRLFSDQSLKKFFSNGWNVFDTAIVIISLIPINNADLVVVGRMLRIFRIMRVISVIPELRVLVGALFQVVPKMAYILVLLFIFFYIYGTIGATFFSTINPDLWGNVAISMLTLFRVMTLEGWSDVMYETMAIYPSSWTYFVSFIIITAFAFLNLLIGVVVTVIDQETKLEEQIESISDSREQELVNSIKRLEIKLEKLISP
jgi:voltage-gated sodium channel